jgi:predicted dehydrogenase
MHGEVFMEKVPGDGKLRIGLSGTGWIGRHHGASAAANPRAELVAVYNPNLDKAEAFVRRVGTAAAVCRSYEQLLKHPGLQAVIIASPNAAHAEQAIAAAQAGKHIFLEKPMALTLEDCRAIVNAVGRAGVKLDMGYHRRLNPIAQFARQLIADGRLGDLAFAQSDYFHHVPGDWDIWAWAGKKDIAGTPIHGGTGHNIDLLRYFCGEVAKVSCFRDIKMPRKIQVETEDLAVISLRFASGVLGRVGLFLGPILPFRFTLRLFGTRGTVDDNRVWLDTMPSFEDSITLPRAWVPDNVQGGVSETWKAAIDTFIDDVCLDREPFNDAVSGFNTAAVCFAALESAREHRAVRPERL